MSAPNLSRTDAAARAELLDVHGYDVELDLSDGATTGTFRSKTTVRFACRRPTASTFIDVVATRFHEVMLNGRTLSTDGYTEERGFPLTDLAEENVLVLDADLVYVNTGQGLHRTVDTSDGATYLYTQFETAEAKRVYACFDQPDLKATFTLSVAAPDSWQVISNGAVEQTTSNAPGTATTRFAVTAPLSPYVTAVAAGPYHRITDQHDGIDLGLYCRASMTEFLDADAIFEVTKQGFDFFHQAFDYRYPFGKYDQLFVPEFNFGAMENAACVVIRDEYVFRSKVTDAAYARRAETILHEMAHMWFGDLVTMRWWDDLWLNESFATFASVLCQAEATRFTSAWTTFANVDKAWAYRQDQLPSTHPIAADMVDVESVEANFDGITYATGASVLKQLVAYVGLENFLTALRAYFRDHEYGNTTLADLLAALEKASGRDLSGWSGQWLEASGINTIRPDFEVAADGTFASFALTQEAPPIAGAATENVRRDHRLAVGLYSGDPLTRVHRVELDVSGERTEVPELIGVAKPDVVLINDDDLTYCKLRLDADSLATVTGRIGTFAESLPRALVWTAAWDMTRDSELAARDYVALILAGIDSETDIGVVQTLHAQARRTVESYADPTWVSTGWALLAETAYAALQAAVPGSDHQLAWARFLAATARSDAHLDHLAALLDGSTTLPGLAVDTNLRWALLQALVALGRADGDAIEAELGRDATTDGEQHAALARARRPTADAKEQAWRRATEDDSLPNLTNQFICRGFAHPAQTELTAPYGDRYFAEIDAVWKRRASMIASQIATLLFPDGATEEVLAAADAWLAGEDHEPPLRRIVVEARDGVRRALAAQACDRAAG